MKTWGRIVMIICLTTVTMKTLAQKVWSIGPEIGVNFSKYGMDADDNGYLAGVNVGISLTYSVINTFGLTGKITYSEKGADLGDTEERLKYIEIPFTGRFFLNTDGKFRPNLFVGPSFGYLKGVSTREGTGDLVKLHDYGEFYNTYDIGATGGLGLNYEILPSTRLLLDARYTYGFSDITKAAGQINNEMMSISFAFSFGI